MKPRYFGCPDLTENDLTGIFERYHYANPRAVARFARNPSLMFRSNDTATLAVYLNNHGLAPNMETARLVAADIKALVIEEPHADNEI